MTLRKLSLASIVLLLASCGGGGGGGSEPVLAPPPSNNPPPTSGIDRGGVSRGVITGFGSIFVNGVRFDTSAAVFTIDDEAGSESDLAVGKVVTVVGTIDDDGENGSAEDVIFDDEVEGPIDSIDPAAGTLVVLGQTVIVDTDTVFDDSIVPNGLDGLSPGNVVEISGFVGADGSITATHVELTNDTEFELTGVVSALDAGAMTFGINGQVIDYSAAVLEDFPAGEIADGMRVEAKGSGFGPAGELLASEVEFEDDDLPGGDDGDDDFSFEIEGLITRFVSAEDFDVAGQPVTTTASTIYENGSAADLAEGIKVEVEGSRDAAGVLVADKVSLRLAANIEIEAPVDAVDSAAATLTVLGIVVAATDVTRFEDDSDAELPSFGLADVNPGDWVEIEAYTDAQDNLVANEIERDDADDEVRVEAPVESAAQPDLVVLGLTIQTDGNTEFEDVNDTTISADDFFAQAAAGTPVQIKGTVIGDGVILATEVELETPDD